MIEINKCTEMSPVKTLPVNAGETFNTLVFDTAVSVDLQRVHTEYISGTNFVT